MAVLSGVRQDWVRMFTMTLIVTAKTENSLTSFIRGLTSKVSVCS